MEVNYMSNQKWNIPNVRKYESSKLSPASVLKTVASFWMLCVCVLYKEIRSPS